MADIDVVPKRRSSGWIMWLMGAVILAIVLWFVLGRGSDTGTSPGSSIRPLSAPHILAAAPSLL